MTANASLWVNHPDLLYRRVGGLTLLERQLLTLSRAGLKSVWVNIPRPAEGILARLRLPQGLDVHWAGAKGEACPTPTLSVSADYFLRPETLGYIAAQTYPGRTRFTDGSGASVLEAVPFTSDRAAALSQSLPEGASVLLRMPLSEGPILDWLLESGPKEQDGFMARHFDRHLSMALSRRLLDLPVSPNLMTLASCALGLWGTTFFLSSARAAAMAGALLVWLHSVLDGCDGELARIRFQESDLGGALDFWGDNLVHLSLFLCLGVGFSRADRSSLPLAAAAAAVLGIAGSALLSFLRRRGPPPSPAAVPLDAALSRLEAILAQRDFVYLLLLLAAVGKTYEFLWAGAVGSLLFFIMILYLGRANHEQAGAPHYSR